METMLWHICHSSETQHSTCPQQRQAAHCCKHLCWQGAHHAWDWQATSMVDIFLYPYPCTCIWMSVKRRVYRAPQCKASHSHQLMRGWFLYKSDTKFLNANESWIWLSSCHQHLISSSRGMSLYFFDSHLYCSLKAAEHGTGLVQPDGAWTGDISQMKPKYYKICSSLTSNYECFITYHISKLIYS